MTLRSRFHIGQTVKYLSAVGKWTEVKVVGFSPGGNYVHVAHEGSPGATAVSESEARKRLLAPGEDPAIAQLTPRQRKLLDEVRAASACYLSGPDVAVARKLAKLKLVKLEDYGEMRLLGTGRSDGERWWCEAIQPAAAKKTRVMVMMLDYTELPRAYGVADTEDAARAEAQRQLAKYCEKQVVLGEPMLTDPRNYTEKVVLVDEHGKEIEKP